jgi:hypothetical protein
MTLGLIFLIAALLCFCAAAAGIPSRLSLTDVGLALVVLYLIVSRTP